MNFENIHRSKKWAFIDGALCSAIVAFMLHRHYSEKSAIKAAQARSIADDRKWEKYQQGFHDGYRKRFLDLAHLIDTTKYEKHYNHKFNPNYDPATH